jgi:hypothetical protein
MQTTANEKKDSPGWLEPGVSIQSVLEVEDAYTEKRRIAAGASQSSVGRKGIALSGGGLRSACFCLGVLSWLEESGHWKEIDYVSSVSGGGYAAASVLNRQRESAAGPYNRTRADVVRHKLRDHEGFIDVTILKLLTVFFLATISGFFCMSPIGLLFGQSIPFLSGEFEPKSTQYVTVTIGVLSLSLGGYYKFFKKSQTTSGTFFFLFFIFLALFVSSWVSRSGQGEFRMLCALVMIAWAIVLAVFTRAPIHPLIVKIQTKFRLPLSFLILLTCSIVFHAGTKNYSKHGIALSAAFFYFTSLGVLGASIATSPNLLNGLLRMYRRGLSNVFGDGADLSISNFHGSIADPLHLINCFLQSPMSDDPKIRHRGGENFCVSRFFCGSSTISYSPTGTWGYKLLRLWPQFKHQRIWRLVATSGAALDTHPARQSPFRNAMFSVFNIGLGAWVINPATRPKYRTGWPHNLLNFLAALGSHGNKAKWIRLSDGGHFENLGIYELVARQCMDIIVVDAGHDPDYVFKDLAIAAQRCREDFGVDIEIPSLIRAGDTGRPSRAGLSGTIRYPNKTETGRLTYLKLCVTDDHPLWLRLRSTVDRLFPHEPTTNQFSTREFVDSYFELGYVTARAAIPANP